MPSKTERAVELASNWLTVIPIKEMNFNLNKREFRDAIKLRISLPLTMLWSAGVVADYSEAQ